MSDDQQSDFEFVSKFRTKLEQSRLRSEMEELEKSVGLPINFENIDEVFNRLGDSIDWTTNTLEFPRDRRDSIVISD